MSVLFVIFRKTGLSIERHQDVYHWLANCVYFLNAKQKEGRTIENTSAKCGGILHRNLTSKSQPDFAQESCESHRSQATRLQ